MESSVDIAKILSTIIALALSISAHEMMHGLVAYRLGDHTAKSQGRISLNPLRHIDPLTTVALPLLLLISGFPPFAAAKPVEVNALNLRGWRWGMAAVAVAGPFTNLAMAIFVGIAIRFSSIDIMDTDLISSFFYDFISMNISLFIFNMIPWPPLDGSRVLLAIAPEGLREIMERLERSGFLSIAIFMFVIFPMLRGFFVTAWAVLMALIVG